MDSPHRNHHASGIPRLSRLPLPRTAMKVPPPPAPTKNALKSRALPGEPARNAINMSTSVESESRTSQSMQQEATKPQAIDTSVASAIGNVHLDPPDEPRIKTRRPRPSLSDRTVETLSHIPATPSPGRRRSTFFPSESPVAPSSRPTSSLSRPRPSTSHDQRPPLPSGFPTPRPPSPTKRQLEPTTGNRMSQNTPTKRAVSSHVPRSLTGSKATIDSTLELKPSESKPPMPSTGSLAQRKIETITNKSVMRPGRTSQTLAARPSRQRPSVQGTFAKPLPQLRDKPGSKTDGNTRGLSPTQSSRSSEFCPTSSASKLSSQSSFEAAGATTTLAKAPASSAALRETIAKAKAARRKVGHSQTVGGVLSTKVTDDAPEIEIGDSNKGLLRKRVASARTDGRLNIAAMGLKDIPNEVLNMYNTDIDLGDGAWYESVDLVRLIAADNELEHLGEDVFPNTTIEDESTNGDDFRGMLFAGLETVDLHGNHLNLLPLGLQRLDHLTILNLSNNKLGSDSLNVIVQIESLRELRLAGNLLEGMLTPQLSNLKKLETLDISNNALTALPPNSNEISGLHVLNVARNKLSSLPFELLVSLPIVEIDAAQNRLGGALFPTCVPGLPHLKTLDVAYNALTSVVETGAIELPALQSLNVAENRLTQLPEMLGWTELLNLTTAGNRLAAFPESIFSLKNLKSVDFSRNDIKRLDERLGLMESLAVVRVAHNPLRERKFLNMDTDTLKSELRSRLLPEESPESLGDDTIGYHELGPTARTDTATPKAWHLKPRGVVDRSSANLEAIEPSDLDLLNQGTDVKTLILHHNRFTQLPQAIEPIGSSLRMLDMSRNKLTGSSCYILTDLSLSNLRSLNLSNNTITSLSPLLDHLSAPQLSELNVSRNHLTSFPVLRKSFPAMASVHASQNNISELQVEPVRGLQVLDVSGNAIAHLEPKLGLLGEEGLRTLVLGANKFRVPRRDVIDKGTEAVLAWLKGRIPEEKIQGLG